MRAALTLLVAVLMAGGCAQRQSQPPSATPTVRGQAPRPPVQTIAVSPAEYVQRAGSASLFVIRASEVIEQDQGTTRFGNHARQLRMDHEGISAQLSFAGRRLNLLPSATLLPTHQAMLDQLRSSGDRGSEYLRQLRQFLPQLLRLHDQYGRLGTSPTLRPVGRMAAPIVRQELQSLRDYPG